MDTTDFTGSKFHQIQPFAKDYGLGTGIYAIGDQPGPGMAIEKSPPPLGEMTWRQSLSTGGIAQVELPGFGLPLPQTYLQYRLINRDPVVQLARSIVFSPILASSFSLHARRRDGKPFRPGSAQSSTVVSDPEDRRLIDMMTFTRKWLEPMWFDFMKEALRALDFGWRPFEKVWEIVDGKYTIKKLKQLLPDFTWIYVTPHGEYNGLSQMDAQIGPEKSMVITYDGEGGNFYGRSRHENIKVAWHKWNELDKKGDQLATKLAAITPEVHYPTGTGLKDANGNVVDCKDTGQNILNGLSQGKGVLLPNMFMGINDTVKAADLAGKSPWIINWNSPQGAPEALKGITDRQRYYDTQKFAGWYRPARMALEAQRSGLGQGDAESHGDSGILESQVVSDDIHQQLSRSAIDDALVLNWGEEARGAVYASGAPLQDAKREVYRDFLKGLWANPVSFLSMLPKLDIQSLFDDMEIPTKADLSEVDHDDVDRAVQQAGGGSGNGDAKDKGPGNADPDPAAKD